MPPPTPAEQGFALPLALTTSSLLLLSSLSLQTLALHGQQRGRHQWQIASRRDAVRSAAMDFSQRSRAEQACLLAWPSDQWSQLHECPTADPQQLLSGEVDGQRWTLKDWQPTGPKGQLVLSSPDFGEVTVSLQVSPYGAWLGGQG
ncbi:hypothetical protein [Synechococcus sp. CC9616]|uniref:hypothetical protein n=1 Tax=Synechococcus sp. CC9616 TaxID=110663 RepID=UPI0012EC7F6E|nr:hypothetical protein [Synechococcus sp. CC9616]